MKNTAHTPAPWAIRDGFLIDGENFPALAQIRAGGLDGTADANGLLIAAAPELLAALRLAETHLRHQAAWIAERNKITSRPYSFEALGEDMPAIDAAIAKATGQAVQS